MIGFKSVPERRTISGWCGAVPVMAFTLGIWVAVGLPSAQAAEAMPMGFSGVEASRPVAASALSSGCPKLAAQREDFQRRVADPIRAWSTQQFEAGSGRRVFYPFSGPDVVTALALFPQASHLVMVADQVIERGALEHPDRASEPQRAQECKTLAFFSRLGYFRTKDLMGAGGEPPRFLAMLLHQSAFAGLEVRQVIPLEYAGPMLGYRSERHVAGVRLQGVDATGRARTVDYLTMNLSDAGLLARPLLVEALRALAAEVVFVKAASHLLQRPNFSTLAGILTVTPRLLVQDETGLDIDRMRDGFAVRAYGQFSGFHPIWAGSPSSVRLSRYLADAGIDGPLPFRLGYEKSAGSILLVGLRRDGAATPRAVRPGRERAPPT